MSEQEHTLKPRDNFWFTINWKLVNREVVRLRKRIFVAFRNEEFRKMRSLQKLLVFSRSNILYSIRKITYINKGSNTPGIDEIKYRTPQERSDLYYDLKSTDFKTYKSIPVKRIYVPKPDGKLRPLGIPTIKDRVIQQCVKNVLEPEWEAQFETSSYGFRPSRAVNDAVNRLFVSLNKENCRTWIVDADIKGCFDNIDHNYIMKQIQFFPYRHLIYEWLKGGILDEGVFYDSEFGTPQGSVISPLLCNITLHGLEKEIGVEITSQGYVKTGGRSIVRYADDLIILTYTKSDARNALEKLSEALKKRGLEVANNKTRITHICDGFDFLGFNFQIVPRDGYTRKNVICKDADEQYIYEFSKTLILIKPSEKSVKKFKTKIKECFTRNIGKPAYTLIEELNPIIRGWANSKNAWMSNRTFHNLDNYLWQLCVRWCKRNHPNKSWHWIKDKYFKTKNTPGFNNKWVFHSIKSDKKLNLDYELLQLKWFKKEEHIMIRNEASPLNPEYDEYFRNLNRMRCNKRNVSMLTTFDSQIASKQEYICPVCGDSLFNGEIIHKHHIISRKDGGKDNKSNLIFLHLPCHHTVHYGTDKTNWTNEFLRIKGTKGS